MSQTQTIYKTAIVKKSLKKAMKFVLSNIHPNEKDEFINDFLIEWLERNEFGPKTRYRTIGAKILNTYNEYSSMKLAEVKELLPEAMLCQLIRKVKAKKGYDEQWLKKQFDLIKQYVVLEPELVFDHYYDLALDTNIHQDNIFNNKKNFKKSKRKINIINPSKTWESTAEYYKPKNLQGVIDCVSIAIAEKKKARAIGIRFSFSGVVQTDQVYIDTTDCYHYDMSNKKRHNQTVKQLDQSILANLKSWDNTQDFESELKKHSYIDIPASMKVKELNCILYPNFKGSRNADTHRFGDKRIYNMGGADLQTFVGAFSTATHGSGGVKSSLQDMVRSILIVCSGFKNGLLGPKVYRIEPSNGITDPVKHQNYLKANPTMSGIELIQDDDVFNSAVVSMGYFGIVYSVIAETLPMRSFHEEVFPQHAEQGGWQGLKSKFSSPAFKTKLLKTDKYVNLLLNPYSTNSNMMINSFNYREITELDRIVDKKEIKGRERKRRFLPRLFLKLFKSKALSKFVNGNRSKAKSIEQTLNAMIDNEGTKKGYTDIFYKAVPAGTAHFKSTGLAIEFAFPFEDYATIMDKLIEKINASQHFTNAPIAIRFLKASDAYLAFNFKKDQNNNDVSIWVAIEVLKIRDVRIEASKNFEFLKEIQKFMLEEGGRPHWGLAFELEDDVAKTDIRAMFPKFDTWKNVYDTLNPSDGGYRVFENKFSKVFED